MVFLKVYTQGMETLATLMAGAGLLFALGVFCVVMTEGRF